MSRDQLQINRRYWLRIMAITLILTSSILLAEFWSSATRLPEYDHIYLGESAADVHHTLADAGIYCFEPRMPSSGLARCDFSDLWRDYTITVDSQNQIVVRKFVLLKAPTTLLTRVSRRF